MKFNPVDENEEAGILLECDRNLNHLPAGQLSDFNKKPEPNWLKK